MVEDPAVEFEIKPSECFELLRPLRGVCDASDLRHESLNHHFTNELQFEPTITYHSVCFSFRNSELAGIHGSCVGDLLRAGDEQFRDFCRLTLECFGTSGDEQLLITFAGFNISDKNYSLSMDQIFYVKRIE